MTSVPSTPEPGGGIRVWATFPDEAGAARAMQALTEAGISSGQLSLAEDPGTSEGPVAHEREHREGGRVGRRLAAGALIGGSLGALAGALIGVIGSAGSTGLALWTVAGALFLGGVGAFVAGLSGLRSAALDHRPTSTEPPGGAAVEVRASEGEIRRVVSVLRAGRPATLVVTDAFGRPLEDLETGRSTDRS
ncbi:MAG TPA: hypothetical protein VJ913_10240 [Actinomycetota bacterium]|nr:hypothetical protein [Actinomycetota bacterium]